MIFFTFFKIHFIWQGHQHRCLQDPLGLGILIGYLWMKVAEVTNLKMIAHGVFYKMPSHYIREHLSKVELSNIKKEAVDPLCWFFTARRTVKILAQSISDSKTCLSDPRPSPFSPSDTKKARSK